MINNVANYHVFFNCAFPETQSMLPLPIILTPKLFYFILFDFSDVFPDTEGLVAEIIINANDGIQGIIGWQNIEYEHPFCLFFSTNVNHGIFHFNYV